MVKDEIWNSVSTTKIGHLHDKCIEKRLGRKLQPEDYFQMPARQIQNNKR